jgi:putative ABC transport system substrate-binding protein
MYPYRDYTEAGGLVAYAPDLGQLAEHLAEQTRFILSGLPVSAIPILQPSNFEFVLNLKAAQDLGIRVAAEIIASADLLIE